MQNFLINTLENLEERRTTGSLASQGIFEAKQNKRVGFVRERIGDSYR